jgi:hypothetical protein
MCDEDRASFAEITKSAQTELAKTSQQQTQQVSLGYSTTCLYFLAGNCFWGLCFNFIKALGRRAGRFKEK